MDAVNVSDARPRPRPRQNECRGTNIRLHKDDNGRVPDTRPKPVTTRGPDTRPKPVITLTPDTRPKPVTTRGPDTRLQQDDNYREFMGWITDGGLRYAYAKYMGDRNPQKSYRKALPKNRRKHVIIVGAGVGGLVAAYELAQCGHKVTILEARSYVGGRCQTLKEGFTDGIYGEAGAIRIPDNHFLTRFYVDKLGLETQPFQYYNPDSYLYVKGEKVRNKDWKRYNGLYCDKWWPGWDSHISKETKRKLNIRGVLDLWRATVAPLRAELGDRPSERAWHKWIKKWHKFDLEGFLRSDEHQEYGPKLRPWPECAIEAYKTTTYTVMTSFSLVHYLRNEFGSWWADPMTSIVGGMEELPRAFTRQNDYGWNPAVKLSENIEYGVKVETVQETSNGVYVEGVKTGCNQKVSYEGDAVFLTIPMQVLRRIDLPVSQDKKDAMNGLIMDQVTRVLLQCRTKFWEKDVGKGGYCKTDLPIGQFLYPDWIGSKTCDKNPGLLTVYTRGEHALISAPKDEEDIVKEAMDQLRQLHPDIDDHVETTKVHVWKKQPTIQAAFSVFTPEDYWRSMRILTTPTERVYLASDTLSWAQSCCSWIQGSLFSALMQAFCFTYYTETGDILSPVNLLQGRKHQNTGHVWTSKL